MIVLDLLKHGFILGFVLQNGKFRKPISEKRIVAKNIF